MRTVLVVDDRREARRLISEELGDAGFEVVAAADGLEGWQRFRAASPDLVITDLRMPRADGIELLRRVRSTSATPVILLTAYPDVPTAVTAMKSGAAEFLTFPDDLDHAIARARELLEAPAGPEAAGLEQMLPGRSLVTRRLRERILALAPLRVPVLVQGERGAGHETAVAALHRLSAEERRRLVVLRACDAASADPWTAKLNEAIHLARVDRHPADAQERWSQRLLEAERGGATPGFRLYASTQADLAALARAGEFHPQLAALLGRFVVRLTPLRDRKEDLVDLVPRLVACIAARVGRSGVRLLPSGLARLRAHSWPGNMRELVSVLERMIAFSRDGALGSRVAREVLGESRETLESFRDQHARREREELVGLLRECGGNLAEVARRLDMSRSAVHYRVRKHGLLAPRRRR